MHKRLLEAVRFCADMIIVAAIMIVFLSIITAIVHAFLHIFKLQ